MSTEEFAKFAAASLSTKELRASIRDFERGYQEAGDEVLHKACIAELASR